MLTSERRLRKQNEKLQEKIKLLEAENKEMRSTIKFFNERVRIVNEKEEKYNKMLDELDVLKIHYQKAIQDAKSVKSKITKELNKIK